MSTDSREEDIHEVMEEEKRRGKRPIDTQAREKARRLRADILKAYRSKDERAFMAILREAGIHDGTPEFVRKLKLFRDVCGLH